MKLDRALASIATTQLEISKDEWARLGELYGKVAFGMPLGKLGPQPTTFVKWSDLLIAAERYIGGVGLCNAWRMPVAVSREYMARVFLASEHEWLFSVDSDMVFEPSTVFRLLLDVIERPEIKMISGTARMGGEPHTPVLFSRKGDTWEMLRSWPQNKLFEIDRVGLFGCLIHRAVFESFDRWYAEQDECWWFCDRARQHGIEIWIDPRAVFGHIGIQIIEGTPDFYEAE